MIVPAHNEHVTIAACLTSIALACTRIAQAQGMATRIIVVCDACSDATATIARALLRGREHVVLEHTYKNVGRARAAGAQAARLWSRLDAQQSSQLPTEHVLQSHSQPDWYAFTDADTCVPSDWLERQMRHSEAGAHAVLGIIKLDPTDCKPELLAKFSSRYQRKIQQHIHGHVHGANLGIRADYYWLVGGFDALPAHEDQQLLVDLHATAAKVIRDPNLIVTTSARTRGRVTAGLSCDLYALQCASAWPLHSNAME